MYRLGELAERVSGRVIGDKDLEISGIGPFTSADAGQVTLAEKKSYLKDLEATEASAVIVPFEVEKTWKKSLLQVERPKVAFARLMALFYRTPFVRRGISPEAVVGEDCRIADDVSIHSFVSVGDRVQIESGVTLYPGVVIGEDCHIGKSSTLYPNVTLYPRVWIGERSILHAGTVIGADGFGYVFDGERQLKIEQIGSVRIEDDVEIGANSCVDRGTFETTVIEQGVKLDNHVHVGHNCRIGAHTVIVGQVGISGSVRIGRNCVFAGHSGVKDNVEIGDGVTVTLKTAVTKDVRSHRVVSGVPAVEHREYLTLQALLRRLPQLNREVEKLKKAVSREESDESQGGDD